MTNQGNTVSFLTRPPTHDSLLFTWKWFSASVFQLSETISHTPGDLHRQDPDLPVQKTHLTADSVVGKHVQEILESFSLQWDDVQYRYKASLKLFFVSLTYQHEMSPGAFNIPAWKRMPEKGYTSPPQPPACYDSTKIIPENIFLQFNPPWNTFLRYWGIEKKTPISSTRRRIQISNPQSQH